MITSLGTIGVAALAMAWAVAPAPTLANAAGLAAVAPQPQAEAPVEAPEGAGAGTIVGMAGLEPAITALNDEAVAAFYAARGYQPVWSKAAGVVAPARARALAAAVRAAPSHALPMRRYQPAALEAALIRPWDAAAEALFTEVYLDYARDISSGVTEPRRIDRRMRVRPQRPEPAALMGALAGSRDIEAHLASLPPSDPDYGRLRQRLAALTAMAGTGARWAEPVGKGRSLQEGDSGPRVAALRARLIAKGDLEPGAARLPLAEVVLAAEGDGATGLAVPQDVFDAALADGVRRFQARHGLNTDGIVGPATRAALNAGPAERARQVAVNLERIRWNHQRLVGDRIVVNLPDFRVRVIEGEASVFESRVVIGKYKHQTYEFSDEMEHLVVNPTWFVPMSIARNEILPKLRENPGYLAERNMRLVGADPAEVDWTLVEPADFPGRIRQAPGPGNALGDVKFMFPNDHAIYLHDTPQKGLFRRDNRAYSHGCIRVQEPAALAAHLLDAQSDDGARLYRRYLNTGREIYVHLDHHRPVHLIYRTAWTGPDGRSEYRGDVYRRDALVAKALEKAGVALPDA